MKNVKNLDKDLFKAENISRNIFKLIRKYIQFLMVMDALRKSVYTYLLQLLKVSGFLKIFVLPTFRS